jgi:cell pole-organizing protein PopZ
MSENQEPTMEEILASIRRIISEDDVPAEPVAAAAPAPPPPLPEPPKAAAPKPAPAPAPAPEPITFAAPADDPAPLVFDDDVLELTDRLDDPLDMPDALAMSDLEVVAPPPRAAAPPPAPSESLVSSFAAGAAASAFDKLERTVMMPVGDRSLEDVVREMLRPMLKTWLDENLPAIVEAQVAAEVERIARQRR